VDFSVVFSPEGKTLAAAGADNAITLWNAASHAGIAILTGQTDAVNSVVFSPDGTMLATGSNSDAVRVWLLTQVSLHT